jgi:hypothetical protein
LRQAGALQRRWHEMTGPGEWLTAQPLRFLVVAMLLATLALFALPLLAWLPGGLVVLALLATGPTAAGLTVLGAAMPIAWGFSPVIGLSGGLIVAAAVLLPAYLAGRLLLATRSLSFAFQASTLAAAGLVLAIRMLLGDPTGVLMPLLDSLRPVLEQTAQALEQLGVQRTPAEIGEATLRVAWATGAWMLLLHTMLSLFFGLWSFARLREPGLFAGQFCQLRLGKLIALVTVAALAAGFVGQLTAGRAWQPAEDLLFVLAAAFLLQALAVVHSLRRSAVIGPGAVVLAYLAVPLAPMLLAGFGLADTWVGFRQRFGEGRVKS